MKRFLSVLLVALLICTACKPTVSEQPLPENPAAGQQPVTIIPDEIPDPTVYSNNTKELSADYPTKEIGYEMQQAFPAAAADFGLRLLGTTAKEGENALISPISAMFALGMTVEGAKGETLTEIKQALLGQRELDIHHNMAAYRQKTENLPQYHAANSVWIKNKGLSVEESFLSNTADHYAAQIFSAPFDKSTMQDINAWVNQHTNSMIPTLLTEPPKPQTIMYLVNALCFEGKWAYPLSESLTTEDTFTAANGAKQTVPMMQGGSSDYYESDFATGFKMFYTDGYGFVALLPNEGTTPESVIEKLGGEGWLTLLTPKENSTVSFTLPKFKTEFFTSLKEPLQTLGIRSAFEIDKADFTGIGTAADGPIFISQVLQKTVFEIDEKGTKAAAATAVAGTSGSAGPRDIVNYTVHLNRPFIYAVVDQNNIPLFLGIANSMQ